MTDDDRPTATCSDCGREVADMEIPACPACGSHNRTVNVSEAASAETHASVGVKAKRAGESKPFRWGKYGDDFHRDSETWSQVQRTFNRDDDTYDEIVTDHEGNIVREVHEPLSEHRGRGSAKLKPPSGNI